MRQDDHEEEEEDYETEMKQVDAYYHGAMISAPLMIPISILPFVRYSPDPFRKSLFIIGAGGWTGALLLRLPIKIIGNNLGLSPYKGALLTKTLSGVCEETIRLLLLTKIGSEIDCFWMEYKVC
jgi:hypothetical protein